MKWRPEWTALLGTKDDGKLAAEFGVSRGCVAWNRRNRGIRACDPAFAHMRSDEATRFWAKVDKGPDEKGYGPHGCWRWRGSITNEGRGVCWYGRRRRSAAAVAWELTNNVVMQLGRIGCHTCDRGHEACVHPAHIYSGTYRQNMRDLAERGPAPREPSP